VDDARRVRRPQDVAQLVQQPAGALRAEAAFAPQQRRQVHATQVFHDEHGAVAAVGVGVAVADRVGMAEARVDVDLAAEVLARPGLGEQGLVKHLDRHVARPVGLARQPDLAHAPLVQQAHRAVFTEENVANHSQCLASRQLRRGGGRSQL
jgi:hypothetical protein